MDRATRISVRFLLVWALEALSLVVMTRLEIRDIRGAWADARRLPDKDKQKKLKAFRRVAAALAGTGDIESIRKWIASQSEAEYITYLYLGAAEGLLEAGIPMDRD